MPVFNRSNGTSLYYEIINDTNRTGDTCLLLGGLTRDCSIWRKVVPSLRKDYQVILLDNRDAGQSTSADREYEISDLAEDVAELIRGMHFCPAHIIGHSMGGFMAIHLAAKHPEIVKTLTLCNTAEKQVAAGIEYLKNRIALIEAQPSDGATTANPDDIIAVMDKIYAPESLLNKAFVEEIIAHESSNKYPQSASSFKRQAQACIKHDASNLLTKINCPTLVITGEKDKFYTSERAYDLASKIKCAKTVVIPNAAHMIQIEQPELLCAAFNKFLSLYEVSSGYSTFPLQ
ncbi:MAG: alpha/beta hydrolase fold protein [Gammaproteobacteria bacterium]|jgi:pimeloyl-ACP methyl ester carboxylesterase|nr:alpha/beta hydrolase fold protein [Gammaproteobacteria bacterium]